MGLAPLNPSNWARGCNGNPYGNYTWPTPTNAHWSMNVYPGNASPPNTYKLTQGLSARGPGYSNVEIASYFMVGPQSSGCYTPSVSKGGLQVVYTWQITEDYYVAANCSSDPESNAWATLFSNATGNVHIGVSPWYVAPGASAINPIINPPVKLSCRTGGGSNVVTHHFANANFQVTFPTAGGFSVAAGTSYDFYSAIWTNASADSVGSGTSAVSLDTVTAYLLQVNCPGC
ncbi:MAG: hypothetical protein ACHQ2Y_06190 [Candidatus Lutacidiplasmatales archaeon]